MGRLSYLIAEEANQGRQKDLKAELSRLEGLVASLSSQLEKAEERLAQAPQRAVEGIVVPQYGSELKALSEAVARLQSTVENIHIPEVPPFPEIPRPEKVDLTPILDGLSALDVQPVVNVEPPIINVDREEREYVFHVERNSAGLIEKVVVVEQDG